MERSRIYEHSAAVRSFVPAGIPSVLLVAWRGWVSRAIGIYTNGCTVFSCAADGAARVSVSLALHACAGRVSQSSRPGTLARARFCPDRAAAGPHGHHPLALSRFRRSCFAAGTHLLYPRL